MPQSYAFLACLICGNHIFNFARIGPYKGHQDDAQSGGLAAKGSKGDLS